MKKLSVMVGLFFLSTVAIAGEINKMPMVDYLQTDMDYVFEIKTTKFDKVILDCQSFITGISFSNEGVMKHNIYLDMFECEDMVNFFNESKRDSLPVCIGVDEEYNELYISRETDKCL